MKTKLSLLLVLILSLSMILAGCGEDDASAFALYTNMNKAMEDVTSMEMDYTMSMEMSVMGESMAFDMKGSAQQVIRSETDFDMAMEIRMDMSALGMPGETSVMSYFKDGYMYQDMLGFQSKTKMDPEEMLAQAGVSMADLDIDESAIKSSEVKDVTGGKELTMTLNGQTMTDMIQPIMDAQMSGMGLDGLEYDISDVTYIVVIGDDNLPKSMDMSLSMEMSIMGETAEISMAMVATYTSFNSVESIDFPADLDDYPEVSY